MNIRSQYKQLEEDIPTVAETAPLISQNPRADGLILFSVLFFLSALFLYLLKKISNCSFAYFYQPDAKNTALFTPIN